MATLFQHTSHLNQKLPYVLLKYTFPTTQKTKKQQSIISKKLLMKIQKQIHHTSSWVTSTSHPILKSTNYTTIHHYPKTTYTTTFQITQIHIEFSTQTTSPLLTKAPLNKVELIKHGFQT